MSGLPGRPDRNDFGPEIKNAKVVRDPTTELDGETIGNLMMHQITGTGLVAPRAWALCDGSAGAAVVVTSRTEGWNTKNDSSSPFDPPVVTRDALGRFFVDYNFSYPNQKGVSTAVDPKFIMPIENLADTIGSEFLFLARARLSATPPAQKFRIVVTTYSWEIGVSADWELADRDFGVLVF